MFKAYKTFLPCKRLTLKNYSLDKCICPKKYDKVVYLVTFFTEKNGFKSCVQLFKSKFSKVARNFQKVNFQKLRATFQKSIFKSCAQLSKVACTFQKSTFKSCVHFSKTARNFQKLRALFKSCV